MDNGRRELIARLGDTHDRLFGNIFPILPEWTDQSGAAIRHYFHEASWAARRIYQRNPFRHIDVASRIDEFVAHVAADREIKIFEFRNSAQTFLTFYLGSSVHVEIADGYLRFPVVSALARTLRVWPIRQSS